MDPGKRQRRHTLGFVVVTLGLLIYWALAASGVLAGSTVGYSGYDGPVLLGTDGRTITVGGFNYPCTGTVSPVADESAARVALRLRWTTPNKHGVCNKAMANVLSMDVHLNAPLGRRALVDGVTGRALSWFDMHRVFLPSALPAGYTLRSRTPGVPTGNDRAGSEYLVGCVQEYVSSMGVLTITQAVGTTNTLLGSQNGPEPIHVRGRPGQAYVDRITWVEGGQVITMESQAYGQGRPLTIGDLIGIADSAP